MLTVQATNEADRMRLTISTASILQRVLSRMGFASKHGKQEWPVVFNTVKYYAPRDVGIIEVDVHRLPRRVRVSQLADAKTLHEISTAIGYPVYVANSRGLIYVIPFSHQVGAATGAATMVLPQRAYTAVWSPPTRRGGYAVPLGVDAAGQHHWYSMMYLQNVLIGGQPGSGKSTLLHAWIMALTSLPADSVKLTVIDPKGEFWFWQGAPHLAHPVIDDIADMPSVIASILDDAAMRRAAIKGTSRDFLGYNTLHENGRLPLHVVIFDELAVFSLLDGGDKVIHEIARIAQAGRSLGIFFVFATQRPGHEVSRMMGVIKAVTDTRIAGRTSTTDDSRIILTKNIDAFHIPRSCPGRVIARIGGRYHTLQTFWVSEGVIKFRAAQLGCLPLEKHDILTDPEKLLVRYAVDKNHGRFTINQLYAQFKGQWSKGRIIKLAQVWQGRGWLTKPAHATDARRVTPELEKLAGIDNPGTVRYN